MFHDIRALLLMIFLATRACVCVRVRVYAKFNVCMICDYVRACVVHVMNKRETRTLLHRLVKSGARINCKSLIIVR